MRRIFGIFSVSLGAVLIGLALLLLIYNQKESAQAETASAEILEKVQKEIEEGRNQESDNDSESMELTVSDEPDTETGSAKTGMKCVMIDGYSYIGYLTVPALNLELPVMADWSYPKLKIAPCREAGSVKTKDLIIAAHNYARHFGNIRKLISGDLVMFTDMDGYTTVYNVGMTEILQPDEVDKMRSTDWDLTLYTCTYGGRTRVAVHCLMADR